MANANSVSFLKKVLSGKTPGRSGGDLEFYKFPNGTEEVKIRVLPKHPQMEMPFKIGMSHYQMPDNKMCKCLRIYDLECPVCNVLTEFEHRIDTSRMASAPQINFNALILSDKTKANIDPNQVHIASGSKAFIDLIMACWEDEDERVFFDPKLGRDLRVHRKKKGGAFDIRPSMSARAIAPTADGIEAILSKLYNLDKIFPDPSDDKVKEVQEMADALRDHFENNLMMKAETGSVKGHNDHDADEEPAGLKKEAQKSKTASSTSTPRPAGAPACFSNPKVYNPETEVCGDCPHEFSCASAIKKMSKKETTTPSEED
jgi:hypothetical protein